MIKHIRPNPVVLLVDLIKILFILIAERPAVLISTGAEIAIPFFYLAKCLFGSKLIYIESCAQVSNPSLTGRIVYPITDLFLVQWPQLLHKYGGKARYAGNLI